MIAAIVGLLPLSTDVPVDPDAGEARRWIIEELSKPAYQAAQPSWFDRLSSAVWNWLTSLRFGDGGAGWPVILIVVVIAVAVVAAFLIFGAPRFNRRSTAHGALFGAEDERDAAAMRASASAAAAAGDWTLAIEELFRALARGLAERTIVTTSPGTTARDFAMRAGGAFPALATDLAASARAFDDVRYLGRPGSERAYRDIVALEQTLRSAHPELAALAGARA
ncbi:DUF4129 domain-containing protein [Parafrigoribacterium humi]|jgi:hypothetical protein|uniref:DUF4129 domain-containing protein n=1 Tax=Parafrigoribacterium humi TaxID=3144664 RepID=UPI0032F0321C